jgi:protocatechuate 3,4-dioxygenase beta subunit
MKSIKRRSFIKGLAAGTSASVFATGLHAKQTTPEEIEGPFYPITPQKDKDADLTRVKGKSGVAKGEIIEVYGQILDQNANPVEDATIDIWQANTFGKYHHPHDENPKPIDENFQSWAIIQSGTDGLFKMKTVMPGEYPIPDSTWVRTPHIHFKVGKLGYIQLITQLYFPNHPLNARDPLIINKTPEETEQMTAKLVTDDSADTPRYRHDIVIEKLPNS